MKQRPTRGVRSFSMPIGIIRQANFLRNEITNRALETTLSRERLGKYLDATKQDLDRALKLYEANTKIAESFYTPLQCLEVCLRNSIDVQLTRTYGGFWFDNSAVSLNPDSRNSLNEARRGLSSPTQGKIVAELKFAFWVALLGRGYDATIWRKSLHHAFRGDNRGKRRSDVHGRFNAIRRFRNRIAHHEPVFHRPCDQTHKEILEALGWMCPQTAAWATFHSRFEATISEIQSDPDFSGIITP